MSQRLSTTTAYLLSLATLAGSPLALADATLFQSGAQPQKLPELSSSTDSPLSLGERLSATQKVNKAVAERRLREALERAKGTIGIPNVKAIALVLAKVNFDRIGSTYKFSQYHQGVRVSESEVVIHFDDRGNVQSIHSTLKAIPADTKTKPELSRQEALKIAVASTGFNSVDVAKGNEAPVLVVAADKTVTLAWEFAIGEREGTGSANIQVGAAGPKTGKILRSLGGAMEVRNAQPNIKIYDGSTTILIPNPIYKGVPVLKNGKRIGLGVFMGKYAAREAKAAHSSFEKVVRYYKEKYGRVSYDGQGSIINVTMRTNRLTPDLVGMRENAAWHPTWKLFMLGGGGDLLGNFASALDVIAHEFTHAVVTSTSNLAHGGQSGALNEHLADVFGTMIENSYIKTDKPFLVGESTLRGKLKQKYAALRDMEDPHKSLGVQPAHMDEIPAEYGPGCEPTGSNDACGVHLLNGVPNRAAAIAIKSLGWEKIEPVFYRVMTKRLLQGSVFQDYRNLMIDECGLQLAAADCEALEKAFAEVGL